MKTLPEIRPAMLEWWQKLFSAFKSREKRMPPEMLNRYIEGILSKREAFLESVKSFGSPHYFFDQPDLRLRLEKFREVFSFHFKQHRIFYAMKSNPYSGICKQVVEAGMGLDVSSGQELAQALRLGCTDIVFSGPGKTDEELELAIKNRLHVTILMDSANEFDRLNGMVLRGKNPHPVRTGIRIRVKTQGSWNKFGIPLPELLPLMKSVSAASGIELQGLQFHSSWNMNPAAQVAMIEDIGRFFRKDVPERLWLRLKFIDIGGGYWPETGEWLNPENTRKGQLIQLLDPAFKFKSVYYLRESSPLDCFAREISTALAAQGPPLSQLEVWTEPGRWIAHPAMHILLRVVDVKDRNTVITDGGINLLGWERPLTEFIPIINLSKPSTTRISCRIFGSLCTPLDIWGTSVFGERIETGDVLVVPDQGAYTYSLRQSFIKPVAEVIHYDGTTPLPPNRNIPIVPLDL